MFQSWASPPTTTAKPSASTCRRSLKNAAATGEIVHGRLEETRVALRNVRRDTIKDLKEYEHEKLITEDDLKKAEDELQKMTDKFIQQVDQVGQKKKRDHEV